MKGVRRRVGAAYSGIEVVRIERGDGVEYRMTMPKHLRPWRWGLYATVPLAGLLVMGLGAPGFLVVVAGAFLISQVAPRQIGRWLLSPERRSVVLSHHVMRVDGVDVPLIDVRRIEASSGSLVVHVDGRLHVFPGYSEALHRDAERAVAAAKANDAAADETGEQLARVQQLRAPEGTP